MYHEGIEKEDRSYRFASAETTLVSASVSLSTTSLVSSCILFQMFTPETKETASFAVIHLVSYAVLAVFLAYCTWLGNPPCTVIARTKHAISSKWWALKFPSHFSFQVEGRRSSC